MVPVLVGIMLCVMLTMLAGNEAAASSQTALASDFAGFTGKVLGQVCNLRGGPGTSNPVVGQTFRGDSLPILGTENGWYRVKTPVGEAWIAGWLLEVDLKTQGITAVVTRPFVNVRKDPDLQSPVLFVTRENTVFSALCKSGDWIQVATPDGFGWIADHLVDLRYPLPPQELSDDVPLVATPIETVNVTQSPFEGSEIVTVLAADEEAQVVTVKGAWVAVKTSGGLSGWVPANRVNVSCRLCPDISLQISEGVWSVERPSAIEIVRPVVNFRSGPGTEYETVGSLREGDKLRILDTRGDWIKAEAPGGQSGYVADWLTMRTGGFRIKVSSTGAIRTLEVTGSFSSAQVLLSEKDNALIVRASSSFCTDVCLPLNCYEFECLSVSDCDVKVTLSEQPAYTVKTNKPGTIVLEFAPEVVDVATSTGDSHDLVSVRTLGYTKPEVHRDGNKLNVLLPGASFGGPSPSGQGRFVRVSGVFPEQTGTSLVIDNPRELPFLLRKTANHLLAHFYTPGLAGKTVVIDPGHEEHDPGTCSPTGLAERDVNWHIAVRLRELLEEAGANVLMTRDGLYERSQAPKTWTPRPEDYTGSLAKRAAWSDQSHVFLSIHNDYHSNSDVMGTTSYVCTDTLNQAESVRLAECVQAYLPATLGTLDRGVRDSSYFVVRESTCPSVLVEVMFLSNPLEEERLRFEETWDAAAAGLLQALQAFFGEAPGTCFSGI